MYIKILARSAYLKLIGNQTAKRKLALVFLALLQTEKKSKVVR